MASYILGSSTISNTFRKSYLSFLYSKYQKYNPDVEVAAFSIANKKAEIEDKILSNMKKDELPINSWYSRSKRSKKINT